MKHVALAAFSILFAVAACSRDSAPKAPAPAPVQPPPALLVDVALPSLEGGLTGIRQFADAVRPGTGMMISERQLLTMTGVGSLDGVAADRPVHILLVEPEKHQQPLAVLVAVSDAAKLKASATAAGVELREKNGHAVLGNAAVVALVADWALDTLAKAPAAAPVATAYSAALLAAYRDDIEQGAASMKQAMVAASPGNPAAADIMTYYANAAIGLLEGSERIELRVDASGAAAALDIGVVSKTGSKVAAFIAAQKPSDFALLERLPAGPSPIVMTGTMLLGSLRAEAMQLFEKMMVSMYGFPANASTKAFMDAWADSATGDMAATLDMSPGRMRMSQLIGAKDPAKLDAATRAFLTSWGKKPITVSMMGTTTVISATPNAFTAAGVTFHRYTSRVDTSAMTPEQVKIHEQAAALVGKEFVGLVGAWDEVVGVSMGGDPAAAGLLVEASRGKAPRLALSPRVSADLRDARARGDSFYYFLDLGAMLSAMEQFIGKAFPASMGLAMTARFADGSGHLRIAVTAADVKSAVDAAAGAGAAAGE